MRVFAEDRRHRLVLLARICAIAGFAAFTLPLFGVPVSLAWPPLGLVLLVGLLATIGQPLIVPRLKGSALRIGAPVTMQVSEKGFTAWNAVAVDVLPWYLVSAVAIKDGIYAIRHGAAGDITWLPLESISSDQLQEILSFSREQGADLSQVPSDLRVPPALGPLTPPRPWSPVTALGADQGSGEDSWPQDSSWPTGGGAQGWPGPAFDTAELRNQEPPAAASPAPADPAPASPLQSDPAAVGQPQAQGTGVPLRSVRASQTVTAHPVVVPVQPVARRAVPVTGAIPVQSQPSDRQAAQVPGAEAQAAANPDRRITSITVTGPVNYDQLLRICAPPVDLVRALTTVAVISVVLTVAAMLLSLPSAVVTLGGICALTFTAATVAARFGYARLTAARQKHTPVGERLIWDCTPQGVVMHHGLHTENLTWTAVDSARVDDGLLILTLSPTRSFGIPITGCTAQELSLLLAWAPE